MSWELFVASLQGRDLEHELHPVLSPLEARAVALIKHSPSTEAEAIMRALAREKGNI